MSSSSARLPAVDVLRGLSILLVVTHHLNLRWRLAQAPVAALLPDWLTRLLGWSGYYAVIVFFVVSGFLITSLSLGRWGSTARVPPARFWLLRAARIAPMLLLTLAALSLFWLAGVPDFVAGPGRPSLPRSLLAALTFHVNWLEGHRGYLPGGWDVLWSLSVEECFYLFFPLLCALLPSPAMLAAALGAFVLVGPLSRTWLSGVEIWDDYAWLSCMDGIALGCLSALLAARMRPAAAAGRLLGGLGIALVLLIVGFRRLTFDLGLTRFGLNVTALELGAALILLSLGRAPWPRWLLALSAPLRLLGRCSYEIYLSHMFVVFAAVRLAPAGTATSRLLPLWYLGAVAAAAALGAALFRSCSEPLNAALRRRWGLQTAGPA